MNQPTSAVENKYGDTPESFMSVTEDELFPIDAINCAKTRARATLSMLINEFGGIEEPSLSSHTVANALWAIDGYIDQIEIMVNHAYSSLHPHIFQNQKNA